MPDTQSRIDLRPLARFDRDLAEAATETGANDAPHPALPNGPGYESERARQRAEGGDPIRGLREVGQHLAGHEAEESALEMLVRTSRGTAAGLLGAAGVLKNTYDLVVGWHRHGIVEGRELGQALARDSMNLAVVALVREHLDPGYVQAATQERHVAAAGAGRLVTKYLLQKPNDVVLAGKLAEAGRRSVERSGVETKEEARALLDRKPKVKLLYETNSAFRHGFESAVFRLPEAVRR